MAKKQKPFPLMRFRKNDPAHNLLAATQHWVRSHGGELLVVGGLGILPEGEHKFKVCVSCLGRRPIPAEPKTK